MASFDVSAVRQEADEAIAKASAAASGGAIDPTSVREIFQEAIFEWTDELNDEEVEALEEAGSSLAAERLAKEKALVALWLAYAEVERRLKQWKQAVKVFSDAAICEICQR